MMHVGISLAADKVTAIKHLLLVKAYILILKEMKDCYRLLLFSSRNTDVLDTSFNCFLLALKQPSSSAQVGLQMKEEVCKRLEQSTWSYLPK